MKAVKKNREKSAYAIPFPSTAFTMLTENPIMF
jgi:hypothetical protein